MSDEQAREWVGKTISIQSRKLHGAITGLCRDFWAGVFIIYSPIGVFGIFPHDVTFIQEEVQ